MSSNRIKFFVLLQLIAASIFAVLSSAKPHAVTPPFSPTIPRVWDDAEMAALLVAAPNYNPQNMIQTELDVLRDVSKRLTSGGVRFMLTGSMAMNALPQKSVFYGFAA